METVGNPFSTLQSVTSEHVALSATCAMLRLRRNLASLICSPTVSYTHLRVLYALQLDDDILLLAKDDKLGRALQDMGLKSIEYTKVNSDGDRW